MFTQSPLRSFTEIPIGSSIEFNGPIANLPANFLFEDGSLLNVSDFPELHSVIGFAWGGDGSTTFRIPDSRGRVARCLDNGAGVDPDRNSRTAKFSGGNTGDNVGTYQGDATRRPNNTFTTNNNGQHDHITGIGSTAAVVDATRWYGEASGNSTSSSISAGSTNSNRTWLTNSSGNHNHSVTGGGDNETRMHNNTKVKAIRVY